MLGNIVAQIKTGAKRGIGCVVDALGGRTDLRGARCLMYHSIVERPVDDPAQMATPLELFVEQMEFLADNGYEVATASDLVRRLRRGVLTPSKSVAITFDDGFVDNYELAVPILEKYRFPATVFLISSLLNGRRKATVYPWSRGYLRIGQAREMKASGLIQFGCHSATHPNLRGLPREVLQEETLHAKHRLEDDLDCSIELFAYPFGTYGTWDQKVLEAVDSAGFEGAFTTIFGINTPETSRLLLKRSRISWCDQLQDFGRILRGAYDWYAHIQRFQRPTVVDLLSAPSPYVNRDV